jgi:hypothetical protein
MGLASIRPGQPAHAEADGAALLIPNRMGASPIPTRRFWGT